MSFNLIKREAYLFCNIELCGADIDWSRHIKQLSQRASLICLQSTMDVYVRGSYSFKRYEVGRLSAIPNVPVQKPKHGIIVLW